MHILSPANKIPNFYLIYLKSILVTILQYETGCKGDKVPNYIMYQLTV